MAASKRTPPRKDSLPPVQSPTQSAGDAVDEQLARYRSMRDFKITAEPSGGSPTAALSSLPFVIQKHAATHLHYDFRLGWNGVLKSWAVAKGPSYVVKDKRLAVQVEDHPMEYGGFEGIIPKGQYGGGTVMVWDQGTWEPIGDFDAGYRDGLLKFLLHGTKLEGKWTLIRMKGKAARETKPNWLLIKEHDENERDADAPCITEEEPNSAVTGRSLEQIAKAETHVWNSKETAKPGQAWTRRASAVVDSAIDDSELVALPKEKLPDFLKPQLAQETEAPPAGDAWLHEIKLDGYRVQARKDGSRVQLFTRTGLDWTHRMQSVAAAVAALPVRLAIFDGEVVVLDEAGVSSFADLQASFESGEKHPLTFFAFDLLHLDGHNTRALPLLERKSLLRSAIGEDTADVHFNDHVLSGGAAVFAKACELHTEGIISKKASAPYTAGRSATWLKSKCVHEQEFVVGGWTELSNGLHGVGALLLGYYDDDGKLVYAGRTGTGFTQKIHRMLREKLDALTAEKMAFAKVPGPAKRGAHWVAPELVVQVRFSTWTGEDLVRQASYLGVREDKAAKDVRKEEAGPSAKHKQAASGSKPAEKTPAKKRARKVAAAPLKDLPMPAIRLTHPDKVVDTASGVTKRELAAYLHAVSQRMLPHIADRPLSLVRCPNGSGSQCFYQKHVNQMLPPGIGSVMVRDKKGGEPEPYITLNSADALVGLAQMTCLEVHPWGSRNNDLEQPDRIIIDLDPDESLPWSAVVGAALEVREKLASINLVSFTKTTGGKGIHVVVPVQPEHDFATVKAWTHGFVVSLQRDKPSLYLSTMTKAARVGKIYLDYLRNERGATAVAPYSMRARAGLPVSVPIEWDELESTARPDFSIRNFPDWRERLQDDPWAAMQSTKQTISAETLKRFLPASRH